MTRIERPASAGVDDEELGRNLHCALRDIVNPLSVCPALLDLSQAHAFGAKARALLAPSAPAADAKTVEELAKLICETMGWRDGWPSAHRIASLAIAHVGQALAKAEQARDEKLASDSGEWLREYQAACARERQLVAENEKLAAELAATQRRAEAAEQTATEHARVTNEIYGKEFAVPHAAVEKAGGRLSSSEHTLEAAARLLSAKAQPPAPQGGLPEVGSAVYDLAGCDDTEEGGERLEVCRHWHTGLGFSARDRSFCVIKNFRMVDERETWRRVPQLQEPK